jgi:large subunit ribosomal protein L16
MLVPKRAKHRKQFRGTMRGKSFAGSELNFGDFGLKAMSCGWVSSRQIESARKTMTHFTQKGGRVWIRIFPDKPVTHKPPETRMGVGKGDVTGYVAVVRPGRILFEMGGLPKEMAVEALKRASAKLPIRAKYIEKVKI